MGKVRAIIHLIFCRGYILSTTRKNKTVSIIGGNITVGEVGGCLYAIEQMNVDFVTGERALREAKELLNNNP